VRDLINAGRIKAYKNGGRTLLDLDSVDEFLRGLPVTPKAVKP
jgi:excisionase family DNA binding protein